jgi:hypothetical protein
MRDVARIDIIKMCDLHKICANRAIVGLDATLLQTFFFTKNQKIELNIDLTVHTISHIQQLKKSDGKW